MTQRLLKNESGYALLATIFALLFLSLILGAALVSSETQLKLVTTRTAIHEAFYTAEAGIGQAIFELRRNPNWNPIPTGPTPAVDVPLLRNPADANSVIGTYTLQVAPGGLFQGAFNTLWIRSTGRSVVPGNTALGQATRVINARVIVENPARFLVSTLGDIHLFGGATVDNDILGKDIFFDVDPATTDPTQKINVTGGDIFYLHAPHNNTNNPAVTFASGSGVKAAPSVTFTGISMSRYQGLAGPLESSGKAIYHNSSTLLEVKLSSLNQATPGPILIVANGDVEISGEYNQSMLVVAGGNIKIVGDVRAKRQPNQVAPQIGLFAKKDVVIPRGSVLPNGNRNIDAFIVADGFGDSKGVFKAEPAGYQLGSLNLYGAVSARGEDAFTAVDMNAFSTRNYVYNNDLVNNRSIPYTPFIVNLIEWQG